MPTKERVWSAKLSLGLQPCIIYQKLEKYFEVYSRAMQTYYHWFLCICQEAMCQINNLDWLRHHKKTKQSVISVTLLITNNEILAKTNGSVIILVSFSLSWLNKSYWTVCCFKMCKHINNHFLPFILSIHLQNVYIQYLLLFLHSLSL